MFLIVIVRCLF